MTLGRVRVRILMGVGAWLLGAAAATAGSLLAVSLLGQGIVASPAQQLSVAAVSRALASQTAKPARSMAPPKVLTHPPKARTRRPAGSPLARPAHPPSSSPASGTALTSQGGTVVATCGPSGAYLTSWSPNQGYAVGNVFRGPAVTTQVTFDSYPDSVQMVVSCRSGVPVATSTVHRVDE